MATPESFQPSWLRSKTARILAVTALMGSLSSVTSPVAEADELNQYNQTEVRTRPVPGTIALTFDDGPHPLYTSQILDILREYDIPATFFVLGWRVEEYSESMSGLIEDGHSIQIHGYQHVEMGTVSARRVEREMTKTRYLIAHHFDVVPTCMRPPKWSMSPTARRVINGLGLEIIGGTVDSQDYAISAPAVLNRLMRFVKPNANIVAHDIQRDWLTPINGVPMLAVFLEWATEQGYQFSTICANPPAPERGIIE